MPVSIPPGVEGAVFSGTEELRSQQAMDYLNIVINSKKMLKHHYFKAVSEEGKQPFLKT